MKFKIAGLAILFAVSSITPNAFSAQFNFMPRVTASSEYTDNVNLTKEDREDDFITVVGAGFTASLLGKTSGAELSFDQSYAFYDENSDNDTWRIPLDFRAWTSLSKRTNLQFTDSFLLTEDPVSQERFVVDENRVEEAGDTTVRRSRNQYYRNTARVSTSHQFGEKDRIYAGFVYGLLRNDDDQIEDNDNYAPSVGLDYWFTNQFGTQFYGEYTRGEYDQQSDFLGEPSSDFDNWLGSLRLLGRISKHFSLFFQYNQIYRNFSSGNDYYVYAPSTGIYWAITKDSYLRLGPGYFYQQIANEKDQENFFLNGEISKNWNFKRGLINLTGLAGLEQNDFGAQRTGFQRFGAIQGKGSYDFSRRISGDINAYYRFSQTPEETAEGENNDLDEHNINLNVGLSFLVTRWMSFRLGYTFNYYNSNRNEDYYENRGLLTLTLQPDRPWRF
jgi:hypothetical protein